MISYRHINQIFYPTNKFDCPEHINQLESYFCTKGFIADKLNSVVKKEYFSKPLFEISPSPDVIPYPESVASSVSDCSESKDDTVVIPSIEEPLQSGSKENQWFEPLHQDTLFWSIFYSVDPKEYETIYNRFSNRELEEKQKIMEFFKKNSKALKSSNYKVTNGMIQEILSELMLDTKKTSFIGLIALSIYYKKQIFLIDPTKKTYLKFFAIDQEYVSSDNIYIYKNVEARQKGKYRLYMKPFIDTNDLFLLEHYNKSLRGLSSYKTDELDKIATSLGISTIDSVGKKLKKGELYEKLVEYSVFLL